MASALSLWFYQALASVRYPRIAAKSRAGSFALRLGPKPNEVARPKGRLVWVHLLDEEAFVAAKDFVLSASKVSGISVVLTSNQVLGSALEKELQNVGIFYQCLGKDYTRTARRFLTAWKPDLGIFLGRDLMPKTLFEAKRSGIRVVYANAAPDLNPRMWQSMRPRYSSALLSCFDEILPVSTAAKKRYQAFGISEEKMSTLGLVQQVADASALEFLPEERSQIARQLGGRSIWLASQLHKEEVMAILAAHRAAERRAPRLLLIIEPRNPADIDGIVEEVSASGAAFNMRSKEGSPSPEVSVFIADEPGELGLWYRLASVSFIGGTFTFGEVESPFHAAALGSAVIHGPHMGAHKDAFERLQAAKAARLVDRVDGLGSALIETIAPDQAAKLAHAAWEISFAGAEAQDRLMEIVQETAEVAI